MTTTYDFLRDGDAILIDNEEREMIPLYIFDLDGTLSLTEHRQHLIEKGREGGPDWDAYFKAGAQDRPNWPVVSMLTLLLDKGCDVEIWTGRGEVALPETLQWLHQHIGHDRVDEIVIHMRDPGDFTPDHELKAKWLRELSAFDRKRLAAVFEDRDRVVAMWRELGVACFQVAEGGF